MSRYYSVLVITVVVINGLHCTTYGNVLMYDKIFAVYKCVVAYMQ